MKTTGLTLAEAYPSGRPFKLENDTDWIPPGSSWTRLTIAAAMSDKWEIQPLPPKQTWTREEVEGIKAKTLKESSGWIVVHVLQVFDEAGV
jgi:hypothetical protein